MRIWPLPLLSGALPLLAVIACYWLSVIPGHIADCNPLLQGCTTISSTGRHGWAYFVFKAAVLPSTGLMLLFWPLAAHWLVQRSGPGWSMRVMAGLGMLSACMLALYTAFLGSEGPLFAIFRRLGASSFLGGTFFCQLLFVAALSRSAIQPAPRLLKLMWGLVGLQFALGLGSLPVTALVEFDTRDKVENLVEWWFGLAMILFFIACAWLWRHERVLISDTCPPEQTSRERGQSRSPG